MKKILFAVLMLAILLPACRKIGSNNALNKIWKLDNVNYVDSALVEVPPASIPTITLDLTAGSAFSGQGPFDVYNGSYKALKDGQLEMSVDNEASVGDSLSLAWETLYFEALNTAYFFDLKADETNLSIIFEYRDSEEGELNFSLQ